MPCRSLDVLIRTVAGPPDPSVHVAAWALDCAEASPAQVRILTSLSSLPQRLPDAGELFLWFGAPGEGRWSNLLPYLDQAEQARAAKFHQVGDRWSFAAAHAGLRAVLGNAIGVSPMEIDFVLGPNGKPQIDPARHDAATAGIVQFNISHTRDLVAVALAAYAVGVDVERQKAISDLFAVADRVFATESSAALAEAVHEAARTAMFFRFWSLGEAFIKATGAGITQDLKTFAFTAEGTPRLLRVGDGWGPAARWQFGLL
jgi:4'-phosphopantetheinyl transferase